MNSIETIYCKSWEVKRLIANYKRNGYKLTIEYVTRGKVVIIAEKRFK